MDVDSSGGRKLEQDLHLAISAGELEVHYQPIVSIDTRRKVAMEALVRWLHPVYGMIAPDGFIAVAEQSGVIHALGELVLRKACLAAVQWPQSCKVAVNLSPVQFERTDLAERVSGILAETGLAANRLELEITESVLLRGTKENLDMLHRLQRLGISIALDDFGTGYSSLTYLRAFAFDKIKIDRSFVQEIARLDVCAAIVCAVANLGRSLNIITTAEGVETAEQFDLLRAAGCTQAQGYLFGRPAPLADFSDPSAMHPRHRSLAIRDVMLVRSSFALVVSLEEDVARRFYDRLFAVAPDLRVLFPKDMSDQKHKLMTVLSACIANLDDLSSYSQKIKNLGARHSAYGARPDHYAIVGEALIWALDMALGRMFTAEIRAAWSNMYETLAETMQAGANEAMITGIAV